MISVCTLEGSYVYQAEELQQAMCLQMPAEAEASQMPAIHTGIEADLRQHPTHGHRSLYTAISTMKQVYLNEMEPVWPHSTRRNKPWLPSLPAQENLPTEMAANEGRACKENVWGNIHRLFLLGLA